MLVIETAIVIQLLSAVIETRRLFEQKGKNESVLEELRQFVELLESNLEVLKKNKLQDSLQARSAIDKLETELMVAMSAIKKIKDNGLFKAVWKSKDIGDEIRSVRERLRDSFDMILRFTMLNALNDLSWSQDENNTSVHRAIEGLRNHIGSKDTMHKRMSMEIRKEMKQVGKMLQKEIRVQNEKSETMASARINYSISEGQGAASNMETVAHLLQQVLVVFESTAASSSSTRSIATAEVDDDDDDAEEQYNDPITCELMCDPVKATDGHTYDRWTIIRNPSAMGRSPFGGSSTKSSRKEEFAIVADDLGVRSRLFRLFPKQEEKFRQERNKYRSEAMKKADKAVKSRNSKGLEEALKMLDFVLQWDPNDGECAKRRRKLVAEQRRAADSDEEEEDDEEDYMCILQFPIRQKSDNSKRRN